MNKITVISGTNRSGSICKVYAQQYYHFLSQYPALDVQLLALEDISHDWFSPAMYAKGQMTPDLIAIQDQYILPAAHFVFITPEYNGSYPGILKLFIDAVSTRQYAANFKGKKAALMGVSSGRAGNLRGMTHLTGVLNYLGVTVMPEHLPVSKADTFIDSTGLITDEETLRVIAKHASDFHDFVN
ncbi:MAG: NAD(P)H-dependent oxidoreductase [Saprospiraceae bacterium]